jgi:hypothetical protein
MSENGAALLDEVEAFHRRFNVFPLEAAYVAVTLWDAHAHLIEAFDSTPRIAFLSPEPGSGKSRALEVIETLVPNRMMAANATANAMFRAVSATETRPTILFDEVDAIFGPAAGGDEQLRAFINAGHRRGASTWRCVGDGSNQTPTEFPSYCAVAMAGLGSLPDTILTRSVIVRMRRRAPNEVIEPWRKRVNEPQGHKLRERLAKWAASVRQQIDGAFPAMPDGVTDRPADVWEPLLAIADAAGGDWPQRARAACLELVNAAKQNDKASIGIRLLTDLRDAVFNGAHRMPTAHILATLNGMDDAPWADMGGRPLDPRGLAKRLGEYVTADNEPVKARNIKTGDGVVKGYYAVDLADAWARYCPPPLESPLPPLPGLENGI